MHRFDKEYWESHWQKVPFASAGRSVTAHPYLAAELADLDPGTALDAGCGEGAEAVWLAARGWQVTAADISGEALARGAERAVASGVDPATIRWVAADLAVWRPGTRFDLVSTFYAHPDIAQLAFYERIAAWVAPGGTLLIVDTTTRPTTTRPTTTRPTTTPPTRPTRPTATLSATTGTAGIHPRRPRPRSPTSRRCSTTRPGRSSPRRSTSARFPAARRAAGNCTMSSCAPCDATDATDRIDASRL